MAKISITRSKPVKPPIKNVTLVLSEAETQGLYTLLGRGVTSEVLNNLNLSDIYCHLANEFEETEPLIKFKYIATQSRE